MATIDLNPNLNTYLENSSANEAEQVGAISTAVVPGTTLQYLESSDLSQGNVGQFISNVTFGAGGTTQTIIQTVTNNVTGTITYTKRGFRLSTGQYEYWITNVWDDGPPSGDVLVDITVIGTVQRTT